MDNSMNESMEQRFVDRLLHALAAMGNYEPECQPQQPTPTHLQPVAAASPLNH